MRRAPRRFVRVMALTTASCAAAAWFTGCCTSKPSDPASRRGAPIPGPSTGDLPDAQLVSKISVPVRILEGKIWSLIPVPQDVQRELRPTDNSLVLRLDSPWRYKCQVGDVYGDLVDELVLKPAWVAGSGRVEVELAHTVVKHECGSDSPVCFLESLGACSKHEFEHGLRFTGIETGTRSFINQGGFQDFILQTVTDVWKALQSPVALGPASDSWLDFRPQGLSATPFRVTRLFNATDFEFDLILDVSARFNVGAKPEASAAPLPLLTAPIAQGRYNDDVAILGPMDVPFAYLNEELKNGLQPPNNMIVVAGKTIYIRSIELRQYGTNVEVGMALDGFLHGTVWFTAQPHYSAPEQWLEFANVTMDFESRNFIDRIIVKWLEGDLIKELNNRLKFKLAHRLADAQAKLSGMTSVSGQKVQFSCTSLYPEKLVVTRLGIRSWLLMHVNLIFPDSRLGPGGPHRPVYPRLP